MQNPIFSQGSKINFVQKPYPSENYYFSTLCEMSIFTHRTPYLILLYIYFTLFFPVSFYPSFLLFFSHLPLLPLSFSKFPQIMLKDLWRRGNMSSLWKTPKGVPPYLMLDGRNRVWPLVRLLDSPRNRFLASFYNVMLPFFLKALNVLIPKVVLAGIFQRGGGGGVLCYKIKTHNF